MTVIHDNKQKDTARRKFLKRCNSSGPKNSWTTLELMEDWHVYVWECCPGALSKLGMDAFCGHVSDRIRNDKEQKHQASDNS